MIIDRYETDLSIIEYSILRLFVFFMVAASFGWLVGWWLLS
jgi:hypothetical protein